MISFGDYETLSRDPLRNRVGVALDKGLLLKALYEDARAAGAELFLNTNVTAIEHGADGITVTGNDKPYRGKFCDCRRRNKLPDCPPDGHEQGAEIYCHHGGPGMEHGGHRYSPGGGHILHTYRLWKLFRVPGLPGRATTMLVLRPITRR